MRKWLWRYGREREALWRLVIDAKFESLKGGWCSKEVSGSFGVGVWKHIRKGWEKFRNFVLFEVGNGTHISFWHNWWCGDRSLKQCFPALFSIVRNKDVMVEDNLDVHNSMECSFYVTNLGLGDGYGPFFLRSTILHFGSTWRG
jgi:hypothetical protein